MLGLGSGGHSLDLSTGIWSKRWVSDCFSPTMESKRPAGPYSNSVLALLRMAVYHNFVKRVPFFVLPAHVWCFCSPCEGGPSRDVFTRHRLSCIQRTFATTSASTLFARQTALERGMSSEGWDGKREWGLHSAVTLPFFCLSRAHNRAERTPLILGDFPRVISLSLFLFLVL